MRLTSSEQDGRQQETLKMECHGGKDSKCLRRYPSVKVKWNQWASALRKEQCGSHAATSTTRGLPALDGPTAGSILSMPLSCR